MASVDKPWLRKVGVAVASMVLLLVIGYVDDQTGKDYSLSLFYLFPIGLAAWAAGMWLGLMTSLVAAAIWLAADRHSDPLKAWDAAYWNAGIRLGIFVVVSVQMSKLRAMKDRLEERVAQKTAALTGEIEQRKRAQRRIRRYQRRLRSLASAVSLAEERERRRLAVDLHDSLSQLLNLAKMRLEAINNGEEGNGQTQKSLEQVRGLVEKAELSARSLTFDLSPPVLYDLGLVPALEWLVDRMSRRYDLAITLTGEENLPPLDESVRVILFRCAQELLTNVAKHAQATEANVDVSVSDTGIQVIVSDNGRGFDPESAAKRKARTSGGFGLFSIQERLRHLGGRVRIHSGPESGSTIELILPIRQPQSPGVPTP